MFPILRDPPTLPPRTAARFELHTFKEDLSFPCSQGGKTPLSSDAKIPTPFAATSRQK